MQQRSVWLLHLDVEVDKRERVEDGGECLEQLACNRTADQKATLQHKQCSLGEVWGFLVLEAPDTHALLSLIR